MKINVNNISTNSSNQKPAPSKGGKTFVSTTLNKERIMLDRDGNEIDPRKVFNRFKRNG